jgi:hypothetical protein
LIAEEGTNQIQVAGHLEIKESRKRERKKK